MLDIGYTRIIDVYFLIHFLTHLILFELFVMYFFYLILLIFFHYIVTDIVNCLICGKNIQQ